MKHQKPRPDFPLTPLGNGQWAKKVKGKLYYFGSWKNDPKGTAALNDWLSRKDGILAGLDHLQVASVNTDWTLGRLVGEFLQAREADVAAGTLSKLTFGDYIRELKLFLGVMGQNAVVGKLTPAHFSAYAKHLIERRKLRSNSRKRTIAYIKACLNWGAGHGYYPAPAYGTAFKAPNTTKEAIRLEKQRLGLPDHSKRVASGAEIDALLSRANPNFRAIVLLSVNCGMGPADIGRLQWQHLDMESGRFDMARGKTGRERHGYLWKRTREALQDVAKLKHTRKAFEREGPTALVFWTRKAQPMYREQEVVEDGRVVDVVVRQAVSITFGRMARQLGLAGLTQYRLRHTFKTLGKKAKDPDALEYMMGHRKGDTGATYDHEEISFKRVRRVSVKVLRRLWPKPRQQDTESPVPMRVVHDDAEAA